MTDLFPADAEALTPLDLSTIADLLTSTTTTVSAEIAGLGAAAGWHPAPGEWSANECVGHLIEAERRGFAGRIRRIIDAAQGDGPHVSPDLESWDPPAIAEARRDHMRKPRELVDEFVALRWEGITLVRTLTPDDLARSGVHPDVGPLRVDELLGEWVHHDRNHVRQLLAVTQARVWSQMGNARRFSLEES
jgi:DinB superfamily